MTLPAIWRFLKNEDGPTTVEYAVMLMIIAGGVISVVQLTGVNVAEFWSNNSNDLNSALEKSNP